MKIEINPAAIKQTTWHEYATRFLVGGLITAATGILAKEFGAVVGGLFLAYPAIFPASATLIEKHETEKKQAQGVMGVDHARQVAGADAAGAAMGSIGLIVFALMVWQLITGHNPWLVIVAATGIWLVVSVMIWWIRRRGYRIIRWFAKSTRRASSSL